MVKGLKLNIEIPDNLKKKLTEHISLNNGKSIETTVINLLEYALSPYPAYFRNYDWNIAEKEADKDIKDNQLKSSNSVKDLQNDLRKLQHDSQKN